MSSLKVFISPSVYVTIDPESSSVVASPFVVASPSCLVELLHCVHRDFFAFLLSRAKEVFYASPRTCSSAQSKEEPQAHFEKRVCLFLALGKVRMVLKTF